MFTSKTCHLVGFAPGGLTPVPVLGETNNKSISTGDLQGRLRHKIRPRRPLPNMQFIHEHAKQPRIPRNR
jgi:hypothetical protein